MAAPLRLVLTVLVVSACTNASSVEEFCRGAVPLFLDQEIGPEPEELLQQMFDLRRKAEVLPDDLRSPLIITIAETNVQLSRAAQGRAGTEGWGNGEIANEVGEICDRDDLFGWTVQP